MIVTKSSKIMSLMVSVTIVAVILVACNSKANTIEPKLKKVKIRITAPLSGPFAYYGTQVQKALDVSFEDQKEKLKNNGIALDVRYRDNSGDAKNAVADFNLFVQQNDVPLIISTNTPLTKPLIPLAEERGMNVLALVTGAKDFAKDTKYVFRDAVMSYEQGVVMARYLRRVRDYKQIATLVVNDDYGLSGARGLEDEVVRLGGITVAGEVFENKDTDMRNQITKIKNKNPQAVFLVGRENNVIMAVQQM